MKRTSFRHLSLLSICFCMLFMSACNKSKLEGLKYIPKEANVVFCSNLSLINDKLKADHISLDSLLNVWQSKDSLPFPKEAIDPRIPVLAFFQSKSSMTMGSSIFTGAVLGLEDKSKLLDYYTKSGDKVIQGEDFSYVQKDKNTLIGFNDKFILVISNTAGSSTDQLNDLFHLKKEESIAANKDASDGLNDKSDISLFVNVDQLVSSIPMLGLTKASDLAKNTFVTGNINFEKGAINLNSSIHYNSTVTDLIKKYPTSGISANPLERFPGKPQMLFEVSFNVNQLIGLLDAAGLKTAANSFLNNMGTSLEDISAAIKGEIAVASTNFRMEDKSLPGFSSKIKQPAADFILTIPILNKAAYDKVARAFTQAGIFKNLNGQLVPAPLSDTADGVVYEANENAIRIASSRNFLNLFNSSNSHIELPSEFKLSGKTSAFYVDFQSLFLNSDAHGDDSANIALMHKTFKNAYSSSGMVEGDHKTGTFTINLMDASQNSLSELIHFAGNLKHTANSSNINVITGEDMNTDITPPPGVDTSAK